MIEFLVLLGFMSAQPIVAEVSHNYFTTQATADRLCEKHNGVSVAGIEYAVCHDGKVFKLYR